MTIYHGDCREIMPELPKVDLVLTDPPYGIGEGSKKTQSRQRTSSSAALADQRDYGENAWDHAPIDWGLMSALLKCGQYACCWGGNYYPVPPSSSWLIWDKENGDNDFADCEMAWTNYGRSVRLKRHMWNGMLRVNREQRFHPTQKPLDVMIWAIGLCPKTPQTILDPFMGSGTTLRAAKDLNRKAIGIEAEEKYCEIAANRMRQEVLPLVID